MEQRIGLIALVVEDYDHAIAFFIGKLHFSLIEDTKLSENKRWVIVRPPGSGNCSLLLAKASSAEQFSRVGNQTGGRVFLFLYTDDIDRDYKNLVDQGIQIIREPSKEAFGMVAVFADIYGNLWDLIEPKNGRP